MLLACLLEAVRSALHDLFAETEAPRSDLDRIEEALAGLGSDLIELQTRQSLALGEWQSALADAQVLEHKLPVVRDSGEAEAVEVEKILAQQRSTLALADDRRKAFQDLASLVELLRAEMLESQARLKALCGQRQAIAGAQQASALLEALTHLHRDLRRRATGDALEYAPRYDRVQRLADRLAALQELDSMQHAEPGLDAGQDRNREKPK